MVQLSRLKSLHWGFLFPLGSPVVRWYTVMIILPLPPVSYFML